MHAPLRNLLCLTTLLTLTVGVAHAAPPDAGTLLNEQRQPGTSLPDRLPTDREKEVVRAPLTDTEAKVLVKEFRFTGGADIATQAELQAVVAGKIGKELGFVELQNIADVVTSYLRKEKGYPLSRAYLPKQDVTAGIIEIVIIAGRIDGNVRIKVKEPRRISQKVLQGIASQAVPASGVARMDQIERATLLINDLPGISAQATLEPGDTSGTTRVIINVVEGPLLSGSISADNHGDRYTGAWRGTGQATASDPFGRGDQLALALTGAENMFQGTAAYTTPLGSSGLNLSLSYTGMYYEIGGDLAYLNANGRADTLSTNISYPLLRSRNASICGGLGFEYLMMSDETNGAVTRDRKIPVGNASLSGSLYDNLGGGGLSSANITLTTGSVDLSGVAAADAADAAGPKTGGSFFQSSYSLARLQRVTQQIALFASLRGQLAGGNLDSSQKFILGGPSGVRAYPVGEASGDEGHVLTLEGRFDVPNMPAWAATQLVGFFDSGWVKLHHDVYAGAITNATGKNDYWLNGAGVGLNIGKAGLYSVRTTYARTLGDNPGRSATGKDADNRSEDNRFWLQALVWF